MTQDDVIRLAKQVGYVGVENGHPILEAFAKLVAEHEREACAKVCDDLRHPWGYSSETSDWERGTEHCADAIRARGQA